jgi:simple sugar transport system substrate-binding protein
MFKKSFYTLFVIAVTAVMLLTACAPAVSQPIATPPEAEAAPTEAPAATEVSAPADTEVPAATEAPAPTAETAEKFPFGLLMVGIYNDRGWSQAHYDAGLYAQEKLPNTEMLYVDKVNVADRPGVTPAQLAEDLVDKGAKLVIFNSDDMKDSAVEFAKANPETMVVHASGDTSWKDGKNFVDLPNMVNFMGRMEYGKMMAGCAAALTTQTGQIGYLGPLINEETRRLAASVYLGAKYCWTEYLGNDPADLKFKVTWIGFWFNIPGVTSDPTQVADEFFNSGYDVVVSGIDTTEALVQANKAAGEGKSVWAISYDYIDGCAEAPAVCLGVPYFNWGPSYVKWLQAAQDGSFKSTWEWNSPDWGDLNNPDTSAVGFKKGDGLSEDASATLDDFITELAGGLNLWTGPINLQDGTEYIPAGTPATDFQVWYLPQLLEGMEGQSVSE